MPLAIGIPKSASTVIIAVLLLADAVVAHADPAAAKERFREGRGAYELGEYASAAAAFENAYREEPRGAAIYNAGLAWELANEPARAADAYAQALAQGGLSDAQASDSTTRLNALRALLGRVRVTATGSGARVSVAHARARPAPAVVYLRPGSHNVRVEWADGHATTRPVRLAAGEQFELLVTPMDEEHVKRSPAPAAEPSPSVAAPAPVQPPSSSRPSSGRRPWIYVVGGVGLAGLAVGSVAGLMALGSKSAVSDNCNVGGVASACTPEGKAAADRGGTQATVSTIGFGVGAAGLVAASVLWLTEPHGGATARAPRVQPFASAGRAEAIAGVKGAF